MSSCHRHTTSEKADAKRKADLTIALAGNANVGKSVLFNCLTGSHQHVGNWPGKTVERAEGSLRYKGYNIDVIDLPGIYSFSTFSLEELVSREYIAYEKPDLVVNVVDACVLERNLFFTLQLIELQVSMVIALSMTDLAGERGISIDEKRLSELLGVPVVSTVGIKGIGVDKLVEQAIETAKGDVGTRLREIRFGKEIEQRAKRLEDYVKEARLNYPPRFVALKLLEGDEEIKKEMLDVDKGIVKKAEEYAKQIEQIHGEHCSVVISSERYATANRIAKEVQRTAVSAKASLAEKIDELITHKVLGYLIMLLIMFSVFYTIFTLGDFLSTTIADFFDLFRPPTLGGTQTILWEGIVGG